jgi:hypothetical protein
VAEIKGKFETFKKDAKLFVEKELIENKVRAQQ